MSTIDFAQKYLDRMDERIGLLEKEAARLEKESLEELWRKYCSDGEGFAL